MEIIKLHHPCHKNILSHQEIVLVLGFFDGVHRGHQAVIDEGKKIAKEKNLKLAVMTFTRHPAIVYTRFNPDQHYYLTTLHRKEAIMEALGVDILFEVDFTASFGSLSPQDFVDQYIVGLNTKVAVAGFDYTYGKPEVASMKHLIEYARNRFEVITVAPQTDENEKISSTRIRKAIKDGKVGLAATLLGYYYETDGFVIHGDARGRTLGYPTANIYPDPYLLLPKRGVYAVELFVNNKWHKGMASIGYNITFEKRRNYSVEVHLFDFNAVIYGEDVRVKWVKFLRDEIKFDSADSLIDQLAIDEINAREILWHSKPTMFM